VLLAADLVYQLAQATRAIATEQTPDRLVVVAGLVVGMIVVGNASGQPLSRIASTAELIALPLAAGALAVTYHLQFDSYYLPHHVRLVSEQGWGLVVFSVVAALVGAGGVIAWGSRQPDRARWLLALSLTCSVLSIWLSYAGH